MPSSSPTYILRQLTPSAAKIYLTFLAATDSDNLTNTISIPIRTLARRTGYCTRTCTLALSKLRSLKLLQQTRRRRHTPASVHTGAPPTKDQFEQTEAQSGAVPAQSAAPVNEQKPSFHPQEPGASPENGAQNNAQVKAQPIAHLSPRCLRSANKMLRNPRILSLVYEHATPCERTALIDHAAKTLARLIAEATAHEK